MDVKEFAATLKAYRAKRGLTQKELAEAIGLTQGGYAGIECGRNKNVPSKEVIEAISSTLNISPEQLTGISIYALEKFGTEVRNWMLTDKKAVAAINATFIKEMEAKINAYANRG